MMTTELIVTRVFSVIIWYHFAFFAISVALFGTGAAAVVVHLRQRTLVTDGAARRISSAAAAFAVSLVAVDVILVNLTPDWFGGATPGPFTVLTGKLLVLFLLAATPFFLGGFAVSLAMSRYSQHVHRLYFSDLTGAGLGCALVVPMLGLLGGPIALVASAAIAVVASFLFARIDDGGRRSGNGAVFAGVAAVVLGAVFAISGGLNVRVAKGIDLVRFPPEYNRWNSFSMVTVLPVGGFRGWGTSPAYHGPVPEQKTLVIDLNAATSLTRFDGRLESVAYSLFDLSAMVYRIKSNASDVCVIGAGGGKDVLAALAAGAKHVTAVEINPLIVDGVVRGAYRDFTGGLYFRPDVDVHVEDGRSFVRGTDRRFDVVLLSMVDTSAATAAGAYSLTENSLYTSDAFADFLSRLTPNGVLSVSTVSLEGLAVGARLVAIARDALERIGASPARSIAVIQTPWLGSTAVLHDVLVKPAGFTDDEVRALSISATQLGFQVAYLPGQPVTATTPENQWIGEIVNTPDARDLSKKMAGWPVDTSAVSDERPFFFYQNRLRDFLPALVASGTSHLFGNGLVVLAKVLLVALFVVSLFLLLPLFVARTDVRRGAGPASADLAYVSCLGLGFMFVEIGVLQRFTIYLGHPTYTLAVVLFVVLVSGGLGSRAFASFDAPTRRRRLAVAIALLIAYLALLAVVAPRFFDATLASAAPLRAFASALLLAPLGFAMGIPFPAGLHAVSERAASRVPWLWAVNSATSVLGSVLATLVSLHAGIDASLAVGAALYAGALALSGRVCSATAPSFEGAPAEALRG